MDVSFWKNWEDWVEIVVDSAAEESVWPHAWGKQFGMGQVSQKMNLVNASGGKINHNGQRDAIVKLHNLFEGEPTKPKGCKSVAG